jgi:hypothetical protein
LAFLIEDLFLATIFRRDRERSSLHLDKVSWGADAVRGPSGRCGCREPGAIAQGFARANREWSLESENEYLRDEVRIAADAGSILAKSASMRRVLEQIEMVAPPSCSE